MTNENNKASCGLFDTHAHLTDERFDEDRAGLIASLPERGVTRVIDIACTVEQAEATLALTREYDFVYAGVGVHPHEVGNMTHADLDALERLSHEEKVVAIGEIGLDYHYDFAPREAQRKWFSEQLELAISLKMPVSLHIREAFGDCMDILRAHRDGLFGVMHCFSGSIETAFEVIDLGLHIAFGGSVTFKNARKAVETARDIPRESILLETDCPYMTPVPYRGTRNDPSFIVHTARKIAEIRGETLDEVIRYTYDNACERFGIK